MIGQISPSYGPTVYILSIHQILPPLAWLSDIVNQPGVDKFYRLSRYVALVKTQLFYKRFFGNIGRGTAIRKPVMLRCVREIYVGENVFVEAGARIQLQVFYGKKSYQPRMYIGDGTSIQQNVHLTCANLVRIGSRVNIAPNVGISDITHPYHDISRSIAESDIEVGEVVVGDESFIGMGATIMPDSHIGKHCMIGANSVVRGSIPDYSVAAGAPARVIRRYDPKTSEWRRCDS